MDAEPNVHFSVTLDLTNDDEVEMNDQELKELSKNENNIPIYIKHENKVNCSVCHIDIDLKEKHKGLFYLKRHIESDTHKLNLELNKDPDMSESQTLLKLKNEFPDLIINKNSIECRVCKTSFKLTWKLLNSKVMQHMTSEEHARLKRKRSYATNSKDISSFFNKKKVVEPQSAKICHGYFKKTVKINNADICANSLLNDVKPGTDHEKVTWIPEPHYSFVDFKWDILQF